MSNRKAIVILGGFGHEGLTTAANVSGYQLLSPALDNVKPKTWLKRAELIRDLGEAKRLACTVIYLHTSLLLQASRTEYQGAFLDIIRQAQPFKTIVFVFRDNLDGIFSMRHWETREPMTLDELTEAMSELEEGWGPHRRIERAMERLREYQQRKDQVDGLLHAIYESGAEVAPFYIRSDVTIRLQELLSDIDEGVFLRLFVPSGRLHADQLRGLLAVLERYLREVEGQAFSVDTRQSDQGTTYVFRSGTFVMDLEALNDAFGRFDSFMKVCGDDPSAASRLLQQKGLSQQHAADLVERYARDYRRLRLDIQHELERKTLLLKQRLDTEVIEGGVAPTITWLGEGAAGLLATAATGANVAINIGTVSLVNEQKIHAEIGQILSGSVVYSENDKQLLALFERYAEPLEALRCRSDLDLLKDRSTPEPSRQNARQRLVGFLRKAAVKAGDVVEKVAVGTLTKYLESLFKGS